MEDHQIDEIVDELFPAPVDPSGDTPEPEGRALTPSTRRDLARLLDEAEYFLDVLACAYDQAIRPHDPDGCTRRTRRLELGIDVPELDIVCLWASRNETEISVPGVEFMAFQVADRLRRVLTRLEAAGSGDYGKSRTDLDRKFRNLLAALPNTKVNRDYPMLGDRFMPPEVLQTWCDSDGDVRRLLGSCKRALGMGIPS